jgi:acetyl-CoA C-acetyltransferase
MADRIAIIAVAKSDYSQNNDSQNFDEMTHEAVERVMEMSGLRFADDGSGIDDNVECNQDHWDGRTISGMNTVNVTGGHFRSDEKVADDGAVACAYAMMQILSGHFDTMLVTADAKESQTESTLVENAGVDFIYSQKLGLDYLSGGALQARRYTEKYGITPEQCAQVVVKNRKNGKNNPTAPCAADLTVKQVLQSPFMASPIRELEIKPVTDGCCALILAREEKAKKFSKKPVWIKGVAWYNDTHYLGYRNLAGCQSLELAAKHAYKMAGISDPGKEIDVVELSEMYAYQELLWSEGLGLCKPGEGARLLESGVTQAGGQLPINPSGGLLSGVPVTTAGLDRIAEAVLQLRGEAGGRQVPGAKRAIAHGTSGICGQLHCVFVLERD